MTKTKRSENKIRSTIRGLVFELLRYALSGVFVFASVYATNNSLFYLGCAPWFATLSGSAASAIVGYTLHARFSFRVEKRTWAMPLKFLIRILICALQAQLLIYLCYTVATFPYPIASFLASAGATVTAFLIAKFWVFQDPQPSVTDLAT